MHHTQPNLDETDSSFYMLQQNDLLRILYKIYPEVNCGYMHKYFNVTGLPMYFEPIEGFELHYENVAEEGI